MTRNVDNTILLHAVQMCTLNGLDEQKPAPSVLKTSVDKN